MKLKKLSALFLCLVFAFAAYGCQARKNIQSASNEPVQSDADSQSGQDESDLNETASDETDEETETVEAFLPEPEINFTEFEQFHLTILHTNDWHGVLDNVPSYATLVREIRDETENVLLLDAGDLYRRGPFEELAGEAEIAVMNAMGYDAVVFGNNDFPRTDEELFNISQHTIVQMAEFPVMLGNVTLDDEYADGFEPYIIITFEDIDVAIIAVTSPKPWDRGFDFTSRYLFEDPVLAVERLAEETADISDIQIALTRWQCTFPLTQ
ncbi:MAG: metallophosphoesterase [Clostridiales bacterium]|jgi:2',3'-cyclic-nucleotide 2'-phosphodiesterase (5'-nucleotidase family)|nr:metallophosphoesterase [Clostridiales bacterium]